MSQPTLSRLENAPSWRELIKGYVDGVAAAVAAERGTQPSYLVGTMIELPRAARLSQPVICEDAALQSGKDKVRRFFQTGYQAKSWSRERKVVARVEATARGTDFSALVPTTLLRPPSALAVMTPLLS